jgi:transcriptional regulator with XRE-family HTH domain
MSSEALRSYLRTLRAEQRITQRQLAQAAEVPEKLIATWERGEVGSLKDGVLLRVASALRAPWEELIALETGRSLDAEDGQRRALSRIACLRAVEATPPAPFMVRVPGACGADRPAAAADRTAPRVADLRGPAPGGGSGAGAGERAADPRAAG